MSGELLVDAIEMTPPLRLPIILRDTLAALVISFAPYIRAPGFCQDLYDAVVDGRISEARAILRGFGVVSIAPFANAGAVEVIGHALESAFRVTEAQAAEFAAWEAERKAHAAALPREEAEHLARVERLLEFIRPPRKTPTRAAKPVPLVAAPVPTAQPALPPAAEGARRRRVRVAG